MQGAARHPSCRQPRAGSALPGQARAVAARPALEMAGRRAPALITHRVRLRGPGFRAPSPGHVTAIAGR
ncbi:hypothetical protein E1267_04680 [Nonomuraea longispora]|uniref:Uncharacterized protein n=1 Tax=Nonomuraea longispora TaxID=1848320 RepID=A0A4R4NQX0_9ACTN|nr:hypothetical protein [Nonomuraea longispora]TDC10323.1 hypothetical protein E1267_04680 [Nonomuraea longispora]